MHDHPELIDLKTLMYGVKMADKSCDLLYIAELILSEKSIQKLPLNNVIKHIKKNLDERYLDFNISNYFYLNKLNT